MKFLIIITILLTTKLKLGKLKICNVFSKKNNLTFLTEVTYNSLKVAEPLLLTIHDASGNILLKIDPVTHIRSVSSGIEDSMEGRGT